MIYTTIPLSAQFGAGSIETFAQALSLSVFLFYWVRQPEKRWLTRVLTVAFLLVLVFSINGLLQ